MTKFHPFACSETLGVVQLEHIPLHMALKIRVREVEYEPLFTSPFDQIRDLCQLSGVNYEKMVHLCQNTSLGLVDIAREARNG